MKHFSKLALIGALATLGAAHPAFADVMTIVAAMNGDEVAETGAGNGGNGSGGKTQQLPPYLRAEVDVRETSGDDVRRARAFSVAEGGQGDGDHGTGGGENGDGGGDGVGARSGIQRYDTVTLFALRAGGGDEGGGGNGGGGTGGGDTGGGDGRANTLALRNSEAYGADLRAATAVQHVAAFGL